MDTFSLTTPAPGEQVLAVFERIRQMKSGYSDRFEIDHYIGSGIDPAVAGCDGHHKKITLPVLEEAPSAIDDTAMLYAMEDEDSEICLYFKTLYANEKIFKNDELYHATEPVYTGSADTQIFGMAKNGSKYIALLCDRSANTITLLVSEDAGNIWTEVETSFSLTGNYAGIAFGADTWVVVSDKYIYYSEDDGETWETIDTYSEGLGSGIYSFYSVKYINSYFIAWEQSGSGLKLLYSADGINWTATSDTLQGYDICHDGAYYWFVDGGSLYKSADFLSWTNVSIGASGAIHGIAYKGGTYVVCGGDSYLGIQVPLFYYSTNGVDWTSGSVDTNLLTASINAMAIRISIVKNYFLITLYAVENIVGIYISSDGTSFDAVNFDGDLPEYTSVYLWNICNNLFYGWGVLSDQIALIYKFVGLYCID